MRLLCVGLLCWVVGCGPASIGGAPEDKNLWVDVSSVAVPADETEPARDAVALTVQLMLKGCPPTGDLTASANGRRLLVTRRGGLIEYPASSLSFGGRPIRVCEPWQFWISVPQQSLGADRTLQIDVGPRDSSWRPPTWTPRARWRLRARA